MSDIDEQEPFEDEEQMEEEAEEQMELADGEVSLQPQAAKPAGRAPTQGGGPPPHTHHHTQIGAFANSFAAGRRNMRVLY